MFFPSRLRSIRLSMQLNQKEFAASLGLSPVTLSHYENGKREPDLDTLCAICKTLNISADYMLGLSDLPSGQTAIRITPSTIPRDPYADLSPASRAILDSVAKTLRSQEDADALEAKKGS